MMLWTLRFLIVLFYFRNAFALKKQFCAPSDNVCLTKAVQEHVYDKFVKGLNGVEPSDPLYLDKVIVNQANFNYTLYRPMLLGMRNCNFMKLRLTQDEISKVTYELECPNLTIKAGYEVKGTINRIQAEGKDFCEIAFGVYNLNISGIYERTMGDDGKLHFHILSYNLELDQKAVSTVSYHNLFTHPTGMDDYFGKNLEKQTRDLVMKKFLNKYVNNLKDFQRIVPIEEVHFRFVSE
ncbi:unnamed protein product [Spodoptera littoralis]|uniref:Uncharacterized protein n=1 Tax=Spodoptera littoralis TaxID=7109 RepID=A0A9P0HY85_SPOLI|nr:unnamed protein product [Spodoptera littoralis]